MLEHKTSLHIFKCIEIILLLFLTCHRVKLKISNHEMLKKISNTFTLKIILLNNLYVKKEIIKKLENVLNRTMIKLLPIKFCIMQLKFC